LLANASVAGMLPVRMLTLGLHLLVSLAAVAPSRAVVPGPSVAVVPGPSVAVAVDAQTSIDADDSADSPRGSLLASTYDEAACDPAEAGECAAEPGISLPAPPAILDCNDARVGLILADMIGTCDMPRRAGPPARLPTVRTASGAPQMRLGDGGRANDRLPLRASAPRDDSSSLPPSRLPIARAPSRSPLVRHDAPLPLRLDDFRLDRPPRA
jgi:hypothetical protein